MIYYYTFKACVPQDVTKVNVHDTIMCNLNLKHTFKTKLLSMELIM